MDQLAKLAFVINQLATYSGPKKVVNSGSTFVSCPYHSEATPSFRVFHSPATKSPGYGKCYGCGAAHPWNDFAEKLGLKPTAYAKPTPLFANSLAIADLQSDEQKTDVLEFSELPTGKVWRSIRTDFLIEIGAQKVVNQWGTGFVYLPVMVLGRKRGYIKARLRKKEGAPSYINSSGSWSRDSGLFLYDYVRRRFKPRVVVLVEGPRDGLRLCAFGIPTITILGTQSWSERKSRLIELLGVTHVILCMDGDCAGIAAVALIEPKLTPLVKVTNFDLAGPDSPYSEFASEDHPTKAAKAAGATLWDPGNMPFKKIAQLRALVARLS